MPKEYEDIRDYYMHKKGWSEDDAQAVAAATYNKHHPDKPMSPAHPHGGRCKKGKK